VPQVVDAVHPVPVVAAGGIGDGRGMAAALCLGAQGVWCGTLFLSSYEAAVTDIHKRRIVQGRSEDWVVSRFSSGKTGRYFKNVLIDEWEKSGLEALPMPLQGMLVEELEEAAKQTGLEELEMSPGGQIGGLIRELRPAAQIVEDLVDQATRVLAGVSQRPATLNAG